MSSCYGVGRWTDDKEIRWDDSRTNELLDHGLDEFTPCVNQSKSMDCGDYVPLCFSFKPEQSEMVWKEKLQWENRKR